MRVKTISASYSRKVNLGDYNSAEIAMSAWVDVDVEDNLSEVNKALWDMLKRNVKEQVVPLLEKQSKTVAETVKFYAGLRVINANGEIDENPSPSILIKE